MINEIKSQELERLVSTVQQIHIKKSKKYMDFLKSLLCSEHLKYANVNYVQSFFMIHLLEYFQHSLNVHWEAINRKNSAEPAISLRIFLVKYLF